MKNLFLMLCLLSVSAFSQPFIQKKDGSKIAVLENSIHISPNHKRLYYKLPDVEKEQRLKFSAIEAARFADYYFKTFAVNKKTKGFYVLAEANGKTLATIKYGKIISRGGFESVLDFYELVVLDANSNLLTSISFSANNSDKNSKERAGVNALIQTHFPDCPKLLEKAKLFESIASDENHRMIMTFLDVPTFINCQ